MANEFQLVEYTVSLTALNAVVKNQSGQLLRNDTLVFETLVEANWSKYLFALSEIVAASGWYAGNFPTGYTTAGTFTYLIYNMAAGTAWANRVYTGYAGRLQWSGIAEVFPGHWA
jgi:hypothetical protein